jgi:hypothetical protein
MKMTLQQMVSSVIEQATEREKLASAQPEVPKPEPVVETPNPSAQTASIDTGTIEKVASAMEYLVNHLEDVDWTKIAVGTPLPPQRENAPPPKMGVGQGATSIQTNIDAPVTGLQSDNTGKASTTSQPDMNPPSDDVGPKDGQTNPSTAMRTDMAHVPGGTGEQPQLVEQSKTSSIKAVREKWAMFKQAADANFPAKINAGSEPSENPNASASEEGVPSSPADKTKQRKMVDSNEAAIGYTKGDAKAVPKAQMGKVLDEPAQKKSSDPVLHENLNAASKAGVKLSSVQSKAARTYLQKLAAMDEDSNASNEDKEKSKKVKEALEKMKKEKEKQSQGMMPPPVTPPPATPAPTGF